MKILNAILLVALLLVAVFSLQRDEEVATPQGAMIEMQERQSDYYLASFSIDTLGADGLLKHTLTGATLTHYPHNDTAEIETLGLQLKRQGKGDWNIASERGWLRDDASHVDLQGKVAMIREATPSTPSMRVDSRDMRIDIDASTIETDSGVMITSSNWQAQGDSLRGDTNTGDLILHNNVFITYAPPQ